MPRAKTPPKPIRLRLIDAAAMCSVTDRHLRREVSRGVLTAVRPRGVGPGKPCFLLAAEVELYAAGRLDELADLKAKAARL